MLDRRLQVKLIDKGRAFTKGYTKYDPYMDDFQSDQELKIPQPPLTKAPVSDVRIALTKDFSGLQMNHDWLSILQERKSERVYTQEDMTLGQLSFLLWATQGVKGLRGRSYATLRTVPCGGARHEFETYLIVRKIDGLEPGAYHYLPMDHTLEYLHPVENVETTITESLSGQSWAAKANVVFCWSMIPYRAEWRYGIYAHRTALIDAGHIGQNLYLACTALKLGTCAIAAFSHELTADLFHLDGEDEYIVYTMPVGTVQPQNKEAEQAFYRFVQKENL